jgi:fatty acid desaturase
MRLHGGQIWSKICSYNQPWRTICKIGFIPALLGLIIMPTIVFWIPASSWPSTVTVALGYVVLALFALPPTIGVIKRIRRHNEFIIEDIVSTLGMYLAIFSGIYMYGLKPTEWGGRAKANHKNVTEQVGAPNPLPAE